MNIRFEFTNIFEKKDLWLSIVGHEPQLCCGVRPKNETKKRGGAMTKLVCNNCDTRQNAEVFECAIPFAILGRAEIARFFLLRVEKCSKCGQKKIQPVYLTHTGQFIRQDFLKNKNFDKAERGILQEICSLPKVDFNREQGGFYLNYGEYGTVKRCYSNLSSLKLGLFTNKDLVQDYAKL